MSKIKCSQNKCKYNNYKYCTKSGIYVDAHANCDSYEEGKKENLSNYEFASLENKENNIVCNACNCSHNKSKNCSINHLNINETNAKEAKCIDFKEKSQDY